MRFCGEPGQLIALSLDLKVEKRTHSEDTHSAAIAVSRLLCSEVWKKELKKSWLEVSL